MWWDFNVEIALQKFDLCNTFFIIFTEDIFTAFVPIADRESREEIQFGTPLKTTNCKDKDSDCKSLKQNSQIGPTHGEINCVFF